MVTFAKELIRTQDLLWAWTARTIRGRYQQSLLGWLWAIIQPAATVVMFTVVFTRFVPIDTGEVPYMLFSYVAIVPWTFLAASLTDMSASLVNNMNLVTKIYFPREILPIAAMLARLMDFGVAGVLVIVLLVAFTIPPFPMGWFYLPLLLAIQFLLLVGLGLACAACNVFYRDVQSLLALGVQLWFYASPVIYPATLVPERFRILYYLNPMTGIIEGYRDVLLNQQTPEPYLLISALVSLVIFVFGYWFFKRVEFQFADIV